VDKNNKKSIYHSPVLPDAYGGNRLWVELPDELEVCRVYMWQGQSGGIRFNLNLADMITLRDSITEMIETIEHTKSELTPPEELPF